MFPILVLLWYPHKEINNSHLLFILVTMKWQWQYNLSISIGPVLEMCSLFWSALCNVSVALLLRQFLFSLSVDNIWHVLNETASQSTHWEYGMYTMSVVSQDNKNGSFSSWPSTYLSFHVILQALSSRSQGWNPQYGIYNTITYNCWWPTVLLSQIAASSLSLNLSIGPWQFDSRWLTELLQHLRRPTPS